MRQKITSYDIASGTVVNSNLKFMPPNTLKGSISGTVQDLTTSEVLTMLNITSSTGGYVPYTVLNDTLDPTGFISPTSITGSYNSTSGTVTLHGVLDYYWRGVKKTLTSPWTSPSNGGGAGDYFLYSNDGNTFGWSTTAWSFSDLMVAKITKSTSPAYSFGIREMHGLMPWQVHQELHENLSSYRVSGGGLATGTYVENTATDVATTPGFYSAIIADEDNRSTIPAWSEGTYTTLHIGASNTTVFDVASSFPFRASGSYILYNTVGTGALSPASTNKYLNVYQIMIPTTSDTESQKYRMVMLQPQSQYNSLAEAQAEDPRSLSLGNLSTSSPEFVLYSRITYITSAGDVNTGKCRIATSGITYILGTRLSQISVSGFTSTAHNSLVGLQGGTSGEYYHLTSAQSSSLGIVNTDSTLSGSGTVASPLSTASYELVSIVDGVPSYLTSTSKSLVYAYYGGVTNDGILYLPDPATMSYGRSFTIHGGNSSLKNIVIKTNLGVVLVADLRGTVTFVNTVGSGWGIFYPATKLNTNSGMRVSGISLELGTPDTITETTTNLVSGTAHTHQILLSSTSLTDVTPTTTFTPYLVGTTTPGSGTYTTQYGNYYAIGKLVYVQIRLVWTAHTGVGSVRINGLPFTVANTPVNPQLVVGWQNLTLLAVGNKLLAPAVATTTQIALQEIGSGAASNLPIGTNTAGILTVNGWYQAA